MAWGFLGVIGTTGKTIEPIAADIFPSMQAFFPLSLYIYYVAQKDTMDIKRFSQWAMVRERDRREFMGAWMIEEREGRRVWFASVSSDYSEIWLCIIRFVYTSFSAPPFFLLFSTKTERQILLFTSVILYNGSPSHPRVHRCLTFSLSPGIDTNLLRGLIFPSVVFYPGWPVICPEPYRTLGKPDRRRTRRCSMHLESSKVLLVYLREDNHWDDRIITILTLNSTLSDK